MSADILEQISSRHKIFTANLLSVVNLETLKLVYVDILMPVFKIFPIISHTTVGLTSISSKDTAFSDV